METKIFKQALLTVIAAAVVGSGAFAQRSKTKQNPKPKAKNADVEVFDSETFNLQMDKLNVELGSLGTQINAAVKGLDVKLVNNLKDLGKNIATNVSVNLDGLEALNNITVNTNDDADDDDDNDKDSDDHDKGGYNNSAGSFANEKVKSYSKTYSIDGNDLIQINNSFGKVTLNTWDRKEVKVDVQIKLGADDDDDVDEMLKNITISDSKVGSTVSFKTNIRNNNNHGRNNHMEINYTVYMPASNPLDVKNSFGSVILPDLSGKVIARVSYGSLNAQQLLSNDNDVKVSFGDGSISNFNGGQLAISYGKLKTGTVSNVNLDIDFAGFSTERLKNSAKVDIKYGDGFNVGVIDRSVRNLNIKASFTKIRLDFSESQSFNFDVTTKMGGFNYDDDKVKVTSKSPSDEDHGWSSTKTYKGYIGKNNSDGKITIDADFTNVKFN
ncbi:hypothetical protein FFF34_013825 [Inquilinus sp. KBS0705]|nr:hypothetical protein FFF34_013825 [Inquilinus sp. KBS0705]